MTSTLSPRHHHAVCPSGLWTARPCSVAVGGAVVTQLRRPARHLWVVARDVAGAPIGTRDRVVPLWYRPMCPLCLDHPRTWTQRTIWTLTDTSTPPIRSAGGRKVASSNLAAPTRR